MSAVANGELTGESDVLIVGAGPAGCAAGIQLSRAGFAVCAIDAARFPRDKVCGDALSTAAVRAVEELGAGAALRAGPHARVARAAAVFPDGARIERRCEGDGCIVPRFALDDHLRRALESAGARVVESRRVTELTRSEGRINGAIGPGIRWSAKLVIATDGYASIGRKALGIERRRGAQLAVSATAYFRAVRFPHGADVSDHFFEDELAYGYAWIFPAIDDVSNVGVYMRSDAFAATGKKLSDLMAGFIARHPDRFEHAEQIGELRSWPLPLAPGAEPLSAPGLLLAGDAAALVDPLSGEGIWQALHSGSLAAETAAEALRSGALDDVLQRRYRAACAHAIMRPSRRKAWVQYAMQAIMRGKLYANPGVRAALRWGYGRQLFEPPKA